MTNNIWPFAVNFDSNNQFLIFEQPTTSIFVYSKADGLFWPYETPKSQTGLSSRA